MKIQTLSGIVIRNKDTEFLRVYAGVIYYWLRSFFDTVYPNNNYEWFTNLYDWDSVEEVVDIILERDPDILLVTFSIWNHVEHSKICELVRQKSKKIKIIIGGPELNAKDIQSNFERFPFTDCLIYGDGESAFHQLMLRYERDGYFTSGLNCAIPGENGFYQRFRYEDFPPYHIYTGSLYKQFKADNDYLREKYSKLVEWSYETNRGCPYTCAFCDWASGLHHKVSKRDENLIYEELDRLKPILRQVILRNNDANFGLLPRDEKLLKYLCENIIPIRLSYWTKTKKPQLYKMWRMYDSLTKTLLDDFGQDIDPNFCISLQSLKKETLEAIKRPELEWKEHKKLVKSFYKDKINDHDPMRMELIQDLPLMTMYDYVYQLTEACDIGVENLSFYVWEFLPNSPANNIEFRNKYNINIVEGIYITNTIELNKLNDLYDVKNWENSYESSFLQNNNLTASERVFSNVLSVYFNHDPKNFTTNLEKNIGKLFVISENVRKLVEKQEQVLGKYVWGIYQQKEKRMYPFEHFFRQFFNTGAEYRIKKERWDFPQKDEIELLIKSYLEVSTQPPNARLLSELSPHLSA